MYTSIYGNYVVEVVMNFVIITGSNVAEGGNYAQKLSGIRMRVAEKGIILVDLKIGQLSFELTKTRLQIYATI